MTIGTFLKQYIDAIPQLIPGGALAALDTLDLASNYATGRITYGKLPQVTAGKLLGNPAGSPGNAQEIALGAGLALSGNVLNTATVPPVEVTSGTVTMAPGTIYIANGVAPITLALPATFRQGVSFIIEGKGPGGWIISQNAGQIIHSVVDTTPGVTGSMASSNRYDNVVLRAITANTELEATARNGNLVVV